MNGLKLALRLALGLMIFAIVLMFLVPSGSAEFWVCVITAVIDGLFCLGVIIYLFFHKKK